MFKKSAAALLALSLPFTASANWSLGGGYANFSDDGDADISLGAIYGSAAYHHNVDGTKFSVVPEFRLGTGISDDEVYGVDVELERFISLSVKGQYDVNEQFFVFAMPSYANAKLKASYGGFSESDDDWEFGYGVGAGFNVSDTSTMEFSFEQYDDADVLTASIHFAF
ncbi:outer membrane protein [Thalassotalea euphylliae]|uniref:outer membrane protein n=1 Tax=Thalassotalea euphylliae TaxID=1655234 RepID=UPI00363537EF